jgi:hypothetical protein
MLSEKGHEMDNYDPFYAPDTACFDSSYDFITATEVVEHLSAPGEELQRLWGLLRLTLVVTLFSSPKGSFNVLIYMHRYTPDTLNQILNGYLVEYREKLKVRMEHLDHLIETGSATEQTKAAKEKDKLKIVLLELQEYERDTLYPLATERIALDLDDGVLVNYNKFGEAIKKVTGLNDKKAKDKVKKFDWIDTSEIR